MFDDPLGHGVGHRGEAAILKGNRQPGGLYQLGVAGGSGLAHQGQIPLPGVLRVGQMGGEELQRHGLGQAVVDVQLIEE